MNAVSVHGGAAVFERMSLRFGLRAECEPCVLSLGMATLSGFDGVKSSIGTVSNAWSSLSQSAMVHVGECFECRDDVVDVDLVEIEMDDDFRTTITLLQKLLRSFSTTRPCFEWAAKVS